MLASKSKNITFNSDNLSTCTMDLVMCLGINSHECCPIYLIKRFHLGNEAPFWIQKSERKCDFFPKKLVKGKFFYFLLLVFLFTINNAYCAINSKPFSSISSSSSSSSKNIPEKRLSARIVTTKYGALRGVITSFPSRFKLQSVESFLGKINKIIAI